MRLFNPERDKLTALTLEVSPSEIYRLKKEVVQFLSCDSARIYNTLPLGESDAVAAGEGSFDPPRAYSPTLLEKEGVVKLHDLEVGVSDAQAAGEGSCR